MSSLLQQLDEQQREAAEVLLGPVCILAGAGSGKTRTITHRIAHGIEAGYYSANRVLALTYTSRAAAELRLRLRELGAGSVQAKTFHSAALAQLEYFWPLLTDGNRAPQVLEGKSKLIADVASELKLKIDPSAIRDLAAEVEWRKYSLLSLEQYQAANRPGAGGLSPGKTLDLLTAYEAAKVATNRIDWEDVLLLLLGLLRSEASALAHVQQQYRFFTVDEYQDISPLQQALLDEWLGDRSDLCVVGDPNQTIYSFTGASSSFLHGFVERYPAAKVVALSNNYRSTQQLVTAANKVRTNDALELRSAGEPGRAPEVSEFQSVAAQASKVAEEINQLLLTQQATPSQIAVLYRINGQSEAIESALGKLGIEYQMRGGVRFFARPEIRSAVQALRSELVSPSQKPTHQVLVDIIRALGWTSDGAKVPAGVDENYAAAVKSKWESLNTLLLMLDEFPEGISVEAFYRELEERQRSQHEPAKAAVTLATIHSAKGLEWDHVFVIGLNEGLLPISYARTEEAIAEEQRLLYVAMTRAGKSLRLSYTADQPPSRYLQLLR